MKWNLKLSEFNLESSKWDLESRIQSGIWNPLSKTGWTYNTVISILYPLRYWNLECTVYGILYRESGIHGVESGRILRMGSGSQRHFELHCNSHMVVKQAFRSMLM